MWMEIFLGFVALFLALYFYVTKNFNRYKDLGVPYKKGVFQKSKILWSLFVREAYRWNQLLGYPQADPG